MMAARRNRENNDKESPSGQSGGALFMLCQMRSVEWATLQRFRYSISS